MSRTLRVIDCGPGTTVQDQGRFGYLSQGASPAGAADLLALHEGAALLGQSPDHAAIEMAGLGGVFQATEKTRIALIGAPMRADLDGASLAWNSSHLVHPGQTLRLSPPQGGNYSYLSVGGGIDTPPFLGARATHTIAQLGTQVKAGMALPVGDDPEATTGMTLDAEQRFDGGQLRIIPSAQTARFDATEIDRLQKTQFARDPRGNRMGARMNFDGAPFQADGQLSILSEMVTPGDIQVTGDGTPFVLLNECQTTGGYPRIGTVIPADIPRVAQARAGLALRFQLITRAEALEVHRRYHAHLKALPRAVRPRLRDPHDIADLLSYQLISGAIRGDESD